MSLQKHIDALNIKHAEIDANIAQEQLRPRPDTLKLQLLKRRKLRLKEELERHSVKH